MARINITIPVSSFELIRDRIGAILADEINQQVLAYNPELDAEITIERTKPFDKTELPAINISLASGNYDNEDARSSDGTYIFNLDVYTSSINTEDAWADTQSALNLHRLLGVVRYIFKNPIYKTLGFQPPFVSRVSVSNFNIAQPDPKDALSSSMGRMVLTVRVPEGMDLITPNLIAGYETNVKLVLTDKGYVFSKLN